MAIKKKFPALGRGLDALIDTTPTIQTGGSSSITEVPIEAIVPNPSQPRREFDEEALSELAESIKQLGIVQPITLRQLSDGKYEIIAGERRWRASKRAGLTSIPAYVRTVSDENMMQMALVENIQREDLNAIEVALAYQALIEQYGLTQEQLSEKVGKKRATVANALRLLKLPAPVQIALKTKQIDGGHARAILGVKDPAMQLRLFREVQRKGYSVRQIEEMAKAINDGETPAAAGKKQKAAAKSHLPEGFDELKTRLADLFQTKVQMTLNAKGRGHITIPFDDEEQMVRIITMFDRIK
ncbi:MAG: ParB/RepB/Spo0J family partition protein [Alloprevotella sp.]|nr:ParB/RepB/Spo0J family partition protein [Alloprevotella sp.]